MSWTYSGNPASSARDALRFLISDTIDSAPIMQDEELDYLIAEYGDNPDRLSYEALTSVVKLFARDYKRSLGPQAEDPTERLKSFTAQAEKYRKKLLASGISLPTYAYPKIFRKGMQSDPPWPIPEGTDYVR